jgi:hypothetical protein
MMDLRALAEFSINFGVTILRSGRELCVQAVIFDQDENMNFLVDNGTVQQERFLEAVRKMIKDFNGKAACLLADSQITKVTSPEANHRIALGESFTAEELLARKWGKRRDAIVCTVEKPGEIAIYHQYYRRNSEGAVILEELQTANPETQALGATGRAGLYRLFEEPEPTVQ